jgi:hypothetical protein
MPTVEVSERELKLLHEAVKSFLDDFGHEEADLIAELRALLAKLPVHEAA